jgi:acetoin utilization deacetylase AcuC-like enzyme
MTTLYYSPLEAFAHDTGDDHPESAQRLLWINKALDNPDYAALARILPPLRSDIIQQLQRIHSLELIERILKPKFAETDYDYLDQDTVLSTGSAQAALSAVNAVCDAVDKICQAQGQNAFCATRPPGHHATPTQAMGFCLFNSVAIAAKYAREHYQLQRVAIVDFDVHHGNGTQQAFESIAEIFYASTHEMPSYPGTGHPRETGVGNIMNVPLYAGESGVSVRHKYRSMILPALRAFQPDLVLISAGFDAHRDDPLGSIALVEEDFRWLTDELLAVADQSCQGRLISVLEGGYHLPALANSVAVHVKSLLSA